MPYTVIINSSVGIGGISEILEQAAAKSAPPYWMGYICTDDLQKTIHAVSEVGAEILVPPTDVPGQGAFSVVHDPQGALIALYQENVSPEGRA